VLRRLALYRGAWKELREVLAKANLGTTVGDDVL
jgi:hypothetical protein